MSIYTIAKGVKTENKISLNLNTTGGYVSTFETQIVMYKNV